MKNKKSTRVDVLFKKIEDGTRDVFSSERYLHFLRTMAKFHQYSFRNSLLIELQKPNATYVAGYHAWSQFNRHVNKDEKGIAIIGYTPVTRYVDVEKHDEYDNPILDDNGNPVKERVQRKIPSFRPFYVYDISQTDGEPLPKLIQRLHGAVENYDNVFDALRNVSPFQIVFDEMEHYLPNTYGYCDYNQGMIVIRAGLSQAQTIKTTVHELAHSKYHIAIASDSRIERTQPDRHTAEIEAESIAYIVSNHLGIDTSSYSFPYIASWSSSKELDELQKSLQTIQECAAKLIKEIDTELEALKSHDLEFNKVTATLTEKTQQHKSISQPELAADSRPSSAPESSSRPRGLVARIEHAKAKAAKINTQRSNAPTSNVENTKG